MLLHSQRRFQTSLLAVWGGLFLSVSLLYAQTPVENKPTVPDEAAQQQALQKLKAQHGPALQKAARDNAAREMLASTLFDQADSRTDLAERYVWLEEAAQLAARSGDARTVLQIVDALEQHFKIDADAMRNKLLQQTLAGCEKADDYKALVDVLRREMERGVEHDRYELARNIGAVAYQAAMKTKYLPLILDVRRERKGVEIARKKYSGIQPFADRLKKDPTDEMANFKVGAYLGLHKGQWKRSLYLLAQGKDQELRLQSQRDLIHPQDPDRQIKVGDGWWQLASTYDGQVAVHLKQRAVFWYEQASYAVEGDVKARLEERIASVPSPRYAEIAWDFSGSPGLIRVLGRHNGNVFGVAFSPDGKRVLSGATNNIGAVWDARTGRKLLTLQGHFGMIWGVAWGPKGKYLFTGSWDGTVKMWDARTGKELRRFPAAGRIADVNGIAISSDGKRLMAGSDDGRVHIWDIRTGRELTQLRGHVGMVYGVAFSPDGHYALSGGGRDRTMIYWNLKTGRALQRFRVGGSIRNVAFSPDGRKAVAAGEAQVRLWNLKTGREIRSFHGHNGLVFDVKFSRNGRRLITAGSDNTIRYWDVNTGRQLHVLKNTSTIYALDISPGGGRVVSGSADNTVRLWGLPKR